MASAGPSPPSDRARRGPVASRETPGPGAATPDLVADLEAAAEELADRFRRAPELWEQAPRGKWNGGRHVDHVASALALFADGFERARRELDAGTLPPPPRRGVVQRLFIRVMTRRKKFPRGAKSPRSVVPGEAPERAATIERLRAAVARYRALADRLPERQRERLWLKNPFLRLNWYYTLPEALRVQALHVRHHGMLVDEIAARRGRVPGALALAPLAMLAVLAFTACPAHAQNPGINKGFMDLNVEPCKNFFRYANGAWYDTASIPAAYTGVGAGREMFDRNQEALGKVLEQARANASTTRDPTLRKLGYLYITAMDSARADREGWEPIKAELPELEAITSRRELGRMFARLEQRDIAAPFRFGPEADPQQSSINIGQLYQAGLGLPDRDYYFKHDPRSEALRTAYVEHLERLFQLLGLDEAKAAVHARGVMRLETALAESSMTLVAQRDPHAIYHKMTVADLGRLAPSVDWPAYFTEVGVPSLAKPGAKLDVSQPGFVTQLDHLIAEAPLDEWKGYLVAHAVRDAAPWLSQAFFDEWFRFSSKLTGVQAPLPRWKRVAAAVDQTMGEALGKAYVEMMFPPSSKAKMLEMVNNLEAAFRERILTREWMSDATRRAAVKKLDAVLKKIGYPDRWRDYSALAIDSKVPGVVNVIHAREFEAARRNRQIGRPVDRMEWGMTPPTVNAYYNALVNEIVFPAGILIPPRFDPKAPDAVNYGAIGMVIGHELTHGFDDEGRQYDARGNLRDWWTAEDAARFQQRAQRVVDQYDGYVAVDSLHVNGRLTLGENLADLGGVTIAYYAFQRSQRGKPRETIEGFTPEQLFFLGFAQSWRRKNRPEIERLTTLTDPHSPAQFRVNGPLSNFPEFAKTFGCREREPMVRDPSVLAEVW